MADKAHTKLAVVGAGSVGASIAYAALIRGSATDVALYDLNATKAEAEVLDLAHGALFAQSHRVTGGGDIAAVEGADVVVITAGAKQKPGQTRMDLAATNAGILRSLMPALMERAPNAVYVLVTNPCDVLTVIAQRESGLPANRIFSSGTVLDSSRLRWRISEMCGVSSNSVHAMIIGEHGDSEFPLWSRAKIGPILVRDWTTADGTRVFPEEVLDTIATEVMQAAYKVIQGKGATNLAIGLSGARIAEAIVRDQHAVLPVSGLLSGQYGLDGIALSLPCVLGANGIERTLEVPMDPPELEKLHASATALQDAVATLG